MNIITRKIIGVATVTLNVKEYVEPADSSSSTPVVKIDISQTLTGGLAGTTEKRITDWKVHAHQDHIFGNLEGQSRLIRGSKSGANEKVVPDLEVQTKIDDEKIAKFLKGETLADGSETEGFLVDEIKAGGEVDFGAGEGLWLQSFVRNLDSGWTAEQVSRPDGRSHTHRVDMGGNRSGASRMSTGRDGTRVALLSQPPMASSISPGRCTPSWDDWSRLMSDDHRPC